MYHSGEHRPSILGVVSFRHAVTTNKRFVPKNQMVGRKPAGENAIARQRPKTQSQHPNQIAKFAPVVNMGDTLTPRAAQLSQAINNSFVQLMDKAVKSSGQDNKHFAAYPSSSGFFVTSEILSGRFKVSSELVFSSFSNEPLII